VLGVDGIADFNALHSRRQEEEVQLYAFDILALDGEDLRSLPSMHQPGAAPGPSAGRDFRRPVRAGRDRSRRVRRMQDQF
jgi:hypothetical protein